MAPPPLPNRQNAKAPAASIRSLFTPRPHHHRSGSSSQSLDSHEPKPASESVHEPGRSQPHSTAVKVAAQKTAPRQPEASTIRVELMSLDPRYKDISCRIRHGSPVSTLERRIRHRYEGDGDPLTEAAVFQFYDTMSHQLAPDVRITKETAKLWYRASKSGGPRLWKLTRWDSEGSPLGDSLMAEMVAAIDAGETVGGLKTIAAKHMGIRDTNRVIMVARDGIRPGTLNGNHWQVRQVKTFWLCRWLALDISPESGYVIFRGLQREYAWYPDAKRVGRKKPVDFLNQYLATRVLSRVHQHDQSELRGRPAAVNLSLDGSPCQHGAREALRWGATYDFTLRADVAEDFSREESWLQLPTESCTTCLEDKKLSEMPIGITSRCKHQPTICKDCLQHWLHLTVQGGAWDRMKCPDCSESMDSEDVKRHASPETSARYDNLTFRAALAKLPTFHFCLSPTCESGQIQDGACARFKCLECTKKFCLNHNVPWHSNETCEEYDRRNDKRSKAERASAKLVESTTRPCPNCQRNVDKYAGCSHITCICDHEWCYTCLAPWQRNEIGFLFCEHAPTCPERTGELAFLHDDFGAAAAAAAAPAPAAIPQLYHFHHPPPRHLPVPPVPAPAPAAHPRPPTHIPLFNPPRLQPTRPRHRLRSGSDPAGGRREAAS